MSSATERGLSPCFQAAFTRFETTVSREDARIFQHTSLEDVWNAIRDTEAQMKARKSLRALKRVEPFLLGIEQYAKVIEVLCNGTPFLPWLWAPVKLFINVALDNLSAFDKLLDAYKLIGVSMPRFDKLSEAFKHDTSFQDVIGHFYTDILQFHTKAYKHLRRRAWKFLFDTSWKRFDSQFQSIIESLRMHQDLVDKEAHMRDIVEAKDFRTSQTASIRQWEADKAQRLQKEEEEARKQSVREAMTWIGPAREQDEEYQGKLFDVAEHNVDTWAASTPTVKNWVECSRTHTLLWLHGIPGAGKSVICSQLVDHVRRQNSCPAMVYCFCNLRGGINDVMRNIWQSLVAQLLVCNKDFAPLIIDRYVSQGASATSRNMKELADMLIASMPSVRIVIDGVDELESVQDQKELLHAMTSIRTKHYGICKVLISSRNMLHISDALRNASRLCIEDFPQQVHHNIVSFIKSKNCSIEHKFGTEIAKKVRLTLERHASGMFLWVRLMHDLLQGSYSARDIHETLESLPHDLETLYTRIIERMCGDGKRPEQKIAIKILQWLAWSKRSLTRSELESGIVFDERVCAITDETRMRGNVLDLCNPLADAKSAANGGVVNLVHFTVLEYLRQRCTFAQLRPSVCNFTVLHSIIIYLASAVSLMEPATTSESKTLEILKGGHDLQLYANENFKHHLEIYCQQRDNIDMSEQHHQVIGNAIEKLAARSGCYISIYPNRLQSALNDRSEGNSWLPRLQVSFQAHEFLNTLLNHGPRLRQSAKSTDGTSSDSPNYSQNPSLLPNMRMIYIELLEQLLDDHDAPSKYGAELVADFKSRHASGGYLCRFPGCPKSSDGFDNSALRDEHETSHIQIYRCTETNCGMSSWTFNSRNALSSHRRKYHVPNKTGPMHEAKDRPLASFSSRTLDQISDLDHLYSIYGHDWAAIARKVSTPMDPKSADEIENFYFERLDRMQNMPVQASNEGSDLKKERMADRGQHDPLSNHLAKLRLDSVQEKFQQQGDDWFAIHNPRLPRQLDIDLLHAFSHSRAIYSVKFNHNGTSVAICSDGIVNIFDVESGRSLAVLENPAGVDRNIYVRDICFSPDGRYLASGGEDANLQLWDVRERELVRQYTGHSKDIYAIDYARNGLSIASASGDCTVKLWDPTANDLRHTLFLEKGQGCTSVVFSHDSTLLAAGAVDNTVHIWNAATGEQKVKWQGHSDFVTCLTFNANSSLLFIGSTDKRVKGWKIIKGWDLSETVSCISTFEGHQDSVYCVASTHDGKWLMSGSKDSGVMFWDPTTGRAHAYLRAHRNTVIGLATSPNGAVFATCSRDCRMRIWKYNTYRGLENTMLNTPFQ